jgi:hypothetical protein
MISSCSPSGVYGLVPFVIPVLPTALAERFALIIEGMLQAVASRASGLNRLASPLLVLIWRRLGRVRNRFIRILQTPPCPGPASHPRAAALPGEARGEQSIRRPREEAPASAGASPPVLPRRRAWLLRLVPGIASNAGQLRHFLDDPEVASLIATDPRLGRILRPLCHALNIPLIQALRPPRRSAAPSSPPAKVPLARVPPAAGPPAAAPPSGPAVLFFASA